MDQTSDLLQRSVAESSDIGTHQHNDTLMLEALNSKSALCQAFMSSSNLLKKAVAFRSSTKCLVDESNAHNHISVWTFSYSCEKCCLFILNQCDILQPHICNICILFINILESHKTLLFSLIFLGSDVLGELHIFELYIERGKVAFRRKDTCYSPLLSCHGGRNFCAPCPCSRPSPVTVQRGSFLLDYTVLIPEVETEEQLRSATLLSSWESTCDFSFLHLCRQHFSLPGYSSTPLSIVLLSMVSDSRSCEAGDPAPELCWKVNSSLPLQQTSFGTLHLVPQAFSHLTSHLTSSQEGERERPCLQNSYCSLLLQLLCFITSYCFGLLLRLGGSARCKLNFLRVGQGHRMQRVQYLRGSSLHMYTPGDGDLRTWRTLVGC